MTQKHTSNPNLPLSPPHLLQSLFHTPNDTTKLYFPHPERPEMSNKHAVISLYRQVLRLHRQKLPAVQRSIGDQYAKKEFRAHQVLEEESEFHDGFFSAWKDYCTELQDFRPMEGAHGWSKDAIREQATLGRDLDPTELAAMSPEQQEQLGLLKESAREAKDNLYNES